MKSGQLPEKTKSKNACHDVLACGLGCGNDDMWDHNDIATYMKISVHTVANHVVVRPGFPMAFVPTGRKGKAEKRYFAREVIDFAKRNRQ